MKSRFEKNIVKKKKGVVSSTLTKTNSLNKVCCENIYEKPCICNIDFLLNHALNDFKPPYVKSNCVHCKKLHQLVNRVLEIHNELEFELDEDNGETWETSKGDQIPGEQLDLPQVFPQTYEEIFLARLRALVNDNGYDLIPLDELEGGEE